MTKTTEALPSVVFFIGKSKSSVLMDDEAAVAAMLAPMASPLSLAGLRPFLYPYRLPLALAGVFLVLAAGATLAFPWALKRLIAQ